MGEWGGSWFSKAKLEAAPEEGDKHLVARTLGLHTGNPMKDASLWSYSQLELESRTLAPHFLWAQMVN